QMTAPQRGKENVLCSVLERAAKAGSPVTGITLGGWQRMAEIAVRRIDSGERRGVLVLDRRRRVEDLAKGLIAALEERPELVGPLKKDYEHVAGLMLDAYLKNADG